VRPESLTVVFEVWRHLGC